MGRVDVLKTLLIVLPSSSVDELVLLLHLSWVDRHPVDQFLSIGCTVLREVHVYEAGQGVPVCS